jgi:hypothetical protein
MHAEQTWPDVAEAVTLAWAAFERAAGDLAGWDMPAPLSCAAGSACPSAAGSAGQLLDVVHAAEHQVSAIRGRPSAGSAALESLM